MDGTEVSEQGDIAQNGEIEAVPQNEDVSAEIESASLNESETQASGDASPQEEAVSETETNSVIEEVPVGIEESPSPKVEVAATTEEAPAESAEASLAPDATPDVEAAPAGEEATAELDGASLMEQYLSDPSHDYKTLKYGDVVDGVIMRIDRDELLVDIGSKSEGIVPTREFSSLSAEEKQALSVGDSVLVFVVQPENQEGHAVVSIDRARQEKSWRKLQEIYEANEVIEAEVTNYNKGGLLVNLDGVRGFVPASQVSEIRGGDEASKQADMARLIGSSLPLKVIEINRHRNRLILSERQAIQERRDVMKERLIEELKEGEVRKGRVSSICDFGAFVDIGGADGLVHLSELSWSRVRHPGEVLKVGQEVDVYVLGINPQEKKIALSIKRTQAEPWSRVAAKYEVGQLVRGVVTQLANFGAFARIEDGIEGLIHVSELADERITHPKQVVQEGQELLLRIIRIDPERRRMGLSLRRALDTPDAELEAVFGPGVIEERDRIVQQIREALEAEGIDMSAPIPAPVETESTEAAELSEPTAEDAVAVEAPSEAPVETADAEPAAETETAAEAASVEEPAPKATRKRSAAKTAPEIPDAMDGEPLSAMAMAFAMAAPDLVVGEESEPAADASDASASDGGEEREA
jgi:small subunit ribosomal protein S1